LGIESCVKVILYGKGEEFVERGKNIGKVSGEVFEPIIDGLFHEGFLLTLFDGEIGTQDIQNRAVCHRTAIVETLAFQVGDIPIPQEVPEFKEESRFTDAGLSDEAHYLAGPRFDLLKDPLECGNLLFPTHEFGQAPCHCHPHPRLLFTGPDQVVSLYHFLHAFDLRRSPGLKIKVILGQLMGLLGDEDGTGGSKALEAGRKIRRVSEAV